MSDWIMAGLVVVLFASTIRLWMVMAVLTASLERTAATTDLLMSVVVSRATLLNTEEEPDAGKAGSIAA